MSKIVKDYLNKEICIPKKIDKIAITCYGGASQEIALFMGGDKIVAQPSVSRFKEFVKVYPNLKDIPSIGSFSDVNIEALMDVNPSIVFVGATSYQMNNRISQMGFPVYTLGIGKHNIDSLLEEFLDLGKILNVEPKAKQLVSYWKQTLSTIKSNLKDIPENREKRVYYTSKKRKKSSQWKKSWVDEFINLAGGINVAAETAIEGERSTETLILWNPDVIVTIRSPFNNQNAIAFRDNPALQNIKAIRKKQVYEGPVGTFWWDRPSPESILGIVWLAKILYPTQMKNIDLKKETKNFFLKFYNYKVSDGEYMSFFENKKTSLSLLQR